MFRLMKIELSRILKKSYVLIFVLLICGLSYHMISDITRQDRDVERKANIINSQYYLDGYGDGYISLDETVQDLNTELKESENLTLEDIVDIEKDIEDIEHEKNILIDMMSYMNQIITYNSNFHKYEKKLQKVMIDMDTLIYEEFYLKDKFPVYSAPLYRNSIEDLYPRLVRWQSRFDHGMITEMDPGFSRILYFMLNDKFFIGAMLLIAILNFSMWSTEFSNGGIKNILTQPYERSKIYFSRLLSRYFLGLVIFLSVILVPPIIAGIKNGVGSTQVQLYVPEVINSFLLKSEGPVYFMLEGVTLDRYGIYAILIGVCFVTFLISFINLISLVVKDTFASGVITMSILAAGLFTFKFNPLSYMKISEVLTGENGIGLLGVVGITLVLAGIAIFIGYKIFTEYEVE